MSFTVVERIAVVKIAAVFIEILKTVTAEAVAVPTPVFVWECSCLSASVQGRCG